MKEIKEKKPSAVKVKTVETVKTTARIVKNAEYLVQAIALIIVSVFAVYAAKKLNLPTFGYYTVIGSAAVIGLRGSYEFIRFLNKGE